MASARPSAAPCSTTRRSDARSIRTPRIALVTAVLGLTALLGLLGTACGPSVDEDFPPGNPVMADEPGDNPVLGSDGPGELVETDTTNYGLLALLAVCLIGAGLLLVRVERWERRRSGRIDDDD